MSPSPSRRPPTGTFRIDPFFRRAGVALAVLGPCLVVAVVARTAAGDQVRTALVLAPFGALFLVLGVEAVVRRIDVDADALTKRSPLRTRILRLDEITTVAYVTNQRDSLNTFRVELFDDDVGSRISIDVRYWDRTAVLVQLARDLDPQHRPDPLSQRLDTAERRRRGWKAGEDPLR